MSNNSQLKVSPIDVFAAYKKTGIRPRCGSWNSCPLGVLAMANGVEGAGHRSSWADDQFGGSFATGFTSGFDGSSSLYGLSGRFDSDYRDGHANGVLIRAAVFKGELNDS